MMFKLNKYTNTSWQLFGNWVFILIVINKRDYLLPSKLESLLKYL